MKRSASTQRSPMRLNAVDGPFDVAPEHVEEHAPLLSDVARAAPGESLAVPFMCQALQSWSDCLRSDDFGEQHPGQHTENPRPALSNRIMAFQVCFPCSHMSEKGGRTALAELGRVSSVPLTDGTLLSSCIPHESD